MQNPKLFAASFLTGLFLFPAFCQAQTISIVSGNGQLVCPDCPINPQRYAPLVVQVNSATGSPVAAGVTVTWTTTQTGNIAPFTATSTTNSAGQASYPFVPLQLEFLANFYPATVVAKATIGSVTASVTFQETTAAPAGEGAADVTVNLVPPSAPPQLTGGLAGSSSINTNGVVTAVKPIVLTVLQHNGVLPNVQVTLQSTTSGLTISCQTQPGQQAGTVLTDGTGTATCIPAFGGKLGSGNYVITVGVTYLSFGSTFSVVTGPPSKINIVSGNNQSVNSGILAPASLVAQVTDAGGNPSSGVPVKWSVTLGTANLSNVVSATLGSGAVSAWVTPIAGPVNVTVALASNAAVQAVFTITVNTVITAMQTVSGNNQVAVEGAAFADPLIVQVNDNNAPVPSASVNFAVTGPATLSASSTSIGTTCATPATSCSVTTNAAGQAPIVVTAGAASGPVVVTASVKSSTTTYTQTFNLVVNPKTATITAIVNAAGFQNQFISPCSLAIVYGTGLAPGLQGITSAMIAPQNQVAGLTIQFGGVLAPILWVANLNGQESASVQVPCDVPASTAVPPATVPVVATVNSVASPPFAVTVLPFSPGIFQFMDTDGAIRAVLLGQDGSVISLANPARPGEVLRMFATGLGQTTPGLVTDEFDPLVLDSSDNWVPQDLAVNAGLLVGVDNSGALILSAKYAADMVGVYEVDFQVPANAVAGNSLPFALVVVQGTQAIFGNASLIPIQ